MSETDGNDGWLPLPGVPGVWTRTPGHDGSSEGPLGSEALNQSCPTPQSSSPAKSKQFRIRLSHHHAERWQQLRATRQDAADLVFGTRTEGIDLASLQGVASELRKIRVEINSLLQLAHFSGFTLDLDRAHAALDRINALLGDKP